MGTLRKGGPQMLKRFGFVAVTVFTLASGCGGDDSADGGKGGGASGASSKGGAAAQGGAAHGGSASGGAAMGGTAAGGVGVPPTDAGAGAIGTGGSITRGGTGGVGEGGMDEGGAPSGGQISTGGTGGGVGNGGSEANGGSANGGSANGGSTNGGSTNGGAPNGGSTDGGSASGGTPNGGSTNGGSVNGGTAGKASLSLNLSAPASTLALDACGSTPAVIPDVPAGSYELELTASNLSKGTVSDENDQEFPSFDDYVIVNLPLPAGDPNEQQRFFMLHGVNNSVSITLPATGSIKLYFIDGDAVNNSGQATVKLKPAGTQATVDATTNVIAWRTTCTGSAPAAISLSKAAQRVTLVSSTFSSAAQAQDPFVLVRLNNEMQVNDHRFIILNGIGASYTFTPYANSTLRAWFISANGGGTGAAQLKIEEQ